MIFPARRGPGSSPGGKAASSILFVERFFYGAHAMYLDTRHDDV